MRPLFRLRTAVIIPVEITATYVRSGAESTSSVRPGHHSPQAGGGVAARLGSPLPQPVRQCTGGNGSDGPGSRAELANPTALQLLGCGSLAELRAGPLSRFHRRSGRTRTSDARVNEDGQVLKCRGSGEAQRRIHAAGPGFGPDNTGEARRIRPTSSACSWISPSASAPKN